MTRHDFDVTSEGHWCNPGLARAIWESPSPGYHRADVSLCDSEATPLHPGLSGSTRDCSGCPPGVEKGVAGRHVSTWVPPGLRGSPPARRRAPPRVLKVKPRYTRGTPRLRQGTTKVTPRQHPGNTRLTPWLHSGHGLIMCERHAGHAGRHPWLHPCRPRSQPGHTQVTRGLHPIRTRVTST